MGDDDRTTQDNLIVMDERYIREFKRDYHRDGKYKLEDQVYHLARLAEHYERRYEITQQWTDCLKAQALYNSCGARKPQYDGWSHRVFEVEQRFWDGKARLSYDQHEELRETLQDKLASIRNGSRMNLVDIEALVQQFGVEGQASDQHKHKFVSLVKGSSVACTDAMISLANSIVCESVKILQQKPPCSFCAVAIGSLARGEATPYSDLEYIFLVEDNSDEYQSYFEDLAMTTYFLMGNFRETKLSYMNIEEIKGWFDDKGRNGFKIDGLAPGAGNIPTGNGIGKKHNHFIISPTALAECYKETLRNQNEKEALRGDLTAMLTYMKSFYTHGEKGESLLATFHRHIDIIEPTKSRLQMNNKMIKADIDKFDFRPNSKLHDCGFTVDVKKNLYRFPSIFLFDLSILWGISGNTSWETADLLLAKGKVTVELHGKLTFLLASACYIRLSAYLHHDSHDDRISVAQKSTSVTDQRSQSHAQKRWFVPIDLFMAMSESMIPLKDGLKKADFTNFGSLPPCELSYTQSLLVQAETLHSCGRYVEALKSLQRLYGDELTNNPQSIIEISSNMSTCSLVADILVKCSHHKAALHLAIIINETEVSVKSIKRLADCYSGLSEFTEALNLLTTTNLTSGEIDLRLGEVHRQLGNFKEAEDFLVLALQKHIRDGSKEEVYDYYGDLETQSDVEYRDLTQFTPEARLLQISNSSFDIAEAISSLQYVYFCKGEYQLAEKYNQKFTDLLFELYGAEALVIGAATALCKIGNNMFKSDQGPKAEEVYIKSLKLCREIYGNDSDHMDIAVMFGNLGHCYSGMHQFDTAKQYFEKALTMMRKLYGEYSNQVNIADQLRDLGWCYNRTKEHEKAASFLMKSLQMYRNIYGEASAHAQISSAVNMIGLNHSDMNQHDQALDCFQRALAMYGENTASEQAKISRAAVLGSLGYCHTAMGENDQAVEYYTQSLMILRECYAHENHLSIAHTLTGLGDNSKKSRNYVQADGYYSQSLSIYRKVYDEENNPKLLATVLHNHGDRYFGMNQHTKAEEFYTEALDMYRELYDIHENIARTLQSIGNNYKAKEDYDKAEEHVTLAIDMYRVIKKSNPAHSGVASALNSLGLICTEKGEYKRSEKYLLESLESYHLIYGTQTNHPSIALVLNNLGFNYNGYGKANIAAKYLQQSLMMRYALHGEENNHEDLAAVMYNLGYNYVDTKEYDKAERMLQRSLDMYKALRSPRCNDITIAKALNDLGANYTEWGKYDKAFEFYHQTIAMEKKIHGPGTNNIPIARALTNLGHNHQRMKQHLKAESAFKESLVMFKNVDNARAPLCIAETYRHMGFNYFGMKLYRDAEENYLSSLAAYQKLPPSEKVSKGRADILRCLGQTYIDMKRHWGVTST